MMNAMISPIFASALDFAFKQATPEGKTTICVLVIVSIFSWSVIITKGRQLLLARKMAKKFFAAYRKSKDPLDMARSGVQFEGAPAYDLYATGVEELDYHLKNNPVIIRGETRISKGAFETVRVAIERAA